jgi:cell volume regulation protein A
LFIGAILILIGIASSKFSARLGLPVLVLFLVVGMLAGSDGIGGIEFSNYQLSNGIGTLALALILFDGGLRTTTTALRGALGPSMTLATAGVLITTLITGAAASWILGIPLLNGLLLGAIIGSTDAAAVFAVMRSKGVRLSERLSSTVEVESASNDPMAVILTVGIIAILQGRMEIGPELLVFFIRQMGIGAVVGLLVARGATYLLNRIHLEAAGLYPILATAAGLLSYGLAAVLGGSGFLAVYLTGIVIGNSRVVFKQGIFHFHDGLAWLAQIAMFVLLGLLSDPSRLAGVAINGLLITGVLIFIARPVAVGLLLAPFRYSLRELLMVSWVGLKGSVPIILGTYPLMAGLPGGRLLFDITFFVVLVSATFQGWSLAPVARWLGLQLPPRPEPPVTLEISSLRHIEGDIVEYTVNPDSRATGQKLRDLDFPESAVVAMIARDQQVIPPRGRTRIEPGDHVFIVLRPEARPLVDRVFTSRGEEEDDDDEPGAGPATDGGQRNSLVSPVAPTTLAAPASPANSASPVAPAASAALRLPGTGPASSTEGLGAIEAPLSQELDAEER